MPDDTLISILPYPPIVGDQTMAGFESMRLCFYGGEIAVRLALKILPQLATSDLWVQGTQLVELHAETMLLLKNLAPDELAYWSYRLGNIINAIERAGMFGEDGLVHIGQGANLKIPPSQHKQSTGSMASVRDSRLPQQLQVS